jgi:hypothetical protein
MTTTMDDVFGVSPNLVPESAKLSQHRGPSLPSTLGDMLNIKEPFPDLYISLTSNTSTLPNASPLLSESRVD